MVGCTRCGSRAAPQRCPGRTIALYLAGFGHPHINGRRLAFSLADIGYAPYIIRLDELQLWCWMDRRPGICRLYDQLKARDSFTLGYLDWRNDSYIDLMRETGADAWPRIERIVAAG